MMFHWRGKAANVDDLIARKRYGQAIAVLRERFRQKSPDAAARQQFAEILILAGRETEAVPVLRGLADEHIRFGFLDKAREVLLRIDDVEPGRPDVARRLREVAAKAAAVATDSGEAEPAAGGFSFAMDEPVARDEPVAHEAPVEMDQDWMDVGPEPEAEPAGEFDLDLEATVGHSPQPEPESASPAEATGASDDEEESFDTDRAITVDPETDEPEVLSFVHDLLRRSDEESASTARPFLGSLLFDRLETRPSESLLSGLRLLDVGAGRTILTEGESGDSVFVVASGTVSVRVRSQRGRDYEVDQIGSLGFFGEIAALSGRPRGATVVAVTATTLLQIDKPLLDALALCRPQARRLLEETCVERATSLAVAAVRSVPLEVDAERAGAALAQHFGKGRWNARMRVQFAELLVTGGNEKDALSILASVAEDLADAGRAKPAIAVLKKIHKITRRNPEELSLAPLAVPLTEGQESGEADPRRAAPASNEAFRGWLRNLLGDPKPPASLTAH